MFAKLLKNIIFTICCTFCVHCTLVEKLGSVKIINSTPTTWQLICVLFCVEPIRCYRLWNVIDIDNRIRFFHNNFCHHFFILITMTKITSEYYIFSFLWNWKPLTHDLFNRSRKCNKSKIVYTIEFHMIQANRIKEKKGRRKSEHFSRDRRVTG